VAGTERATREIDPTTSSAVELVPDRLYALGGMIEMDERVSWLRPVDGGHQPVNAYLLLEPGHAFLVDSGLPYHRDEVIAQLRTLVAADQPLGVFFTRSELDAVGNLALIAAQFRVEVVHGGGLVNPFDGYEEVGMLGRTPADFAVERVDAGMPIPVAPRRDLKVLHAPLYSVHTFWAYDTGTGTLFTSDAFGYGYRESPDYTHATVVGAECSTEQVRDQSLPRFWWLDYVATPRVADELDAMFSEHSIERIAPTHGCVLTDAETQLVKLTRLLRGGPPEATS
jgi:flavorubredoxin